MISTAELITAKSLKEHTEAAVINIAIELIPEINKELLIQADLGRNTLIIRWSELKNGTNALVKEKLENYLTLAGYRVDGRGDWLRIYWD